MVKLRQRKLLCYLKSQKCFCTAKELARHLDCSVKTVYNDVALLQEYLEQKGWGTLYTRPNRGVQLELTSEGAQALGRSLEETPVIRDMPDGEHDPVRKLLHYLLRRRTATIEELGQQIHASRTLVERYLDRVEKWLEKRHLRLVRIRGRGLRVEGQDLYYRIAEWYLFCDYYQALSTQHPVKYADVLRVVHLYLEGFDAGGVAQALQEIENELGVTLAYDAYTRMLFFGSLTVWCERRQLHNTPGGEAFVKTALERRFVKILKTKLQNRFRCQIGTAGQEFLCLGVAIAEITCFQEESIRLHFLKEYNELDGVLSEGIELMGCVLQADFCGDAILEMQLFWMMRSAVVLGKLGLCCRPLDPHLKVLPSAESGAVRTAAIILDDLCEKHFGTRLTPQDTEYLVVVLEAAVRRNCSVCRLGLVCAHGVGVGQILREEIESRIPQAKVVCVLSVRELERLKQYETDLVVSVVPLPYQLPQTEVWCTDMEHLDLAALQRRVRQVGRQKAPMPFYEVEPEYSLFREEAILLNCRVRDKEELLDLLCGRLEALGAVDSEYRNSVRQREEDAPTLLGQELALPHGRAEGVRSSIIALAVMEQPLRWSRTGSVRVVMLAAVRVNDPVAQAAILRFYKIAADLARGRKAELLGHLYSAAQPKQAAQLMNAAIWGKGDSLRKRRIW